MQNRKLDLCALSEVNLGEVSHALKRFSDSTRGRLAIERVRDLANQPEDKFNMTLKTLAEFNLVNRIGGQITVTCDGLEFIDSDLPSRMEYIRRILVRDGAVRRVVRDLKQSSTGRLSKLHAYVSFIRERGLAVTMEEFDGFIEWAKWTELFHYDTSCGDLVRSERGTFPGPHTHSPKSAA